MSIEQQEINVMHFSYIIVHKHSSDITIKPSVELRKICLYLPVTTFIDYVQSTFTGLSNTCLYFI